MESPGAFTSIPLTGQDDPEARRAKEKKQAARDAHAESRQTELFELVRKAYFDLSNEVNGTDGWSLVPTKERIDLQGNPRQADLWEKDAGTCENGHHIYAFKAAMKLACPAHRVVTLNADFQFGRRRSWEDGDLGHVQLVHKVTRERVPGRKFVYLHDTVEVVDSYIDPPTMANLPFLGKIKVPLVAPRRFLVAQWRHWDRGQWLILGQTLPAAMRVGPNGEERYPHREGYEHATDAVGFTGLVAKEDPEDPEHSCWVTSVLRVSPGGYLPDELVRIYKERMLDRAELYERICQDPIWSQLGYPSGVPKVRLRIAH